MRLRAVIGSPLRRMSQRDLLQSTAQGKLLITHKGMVHAAKVIAGKALKVPLDPDLLARAKAEHAEHTRKTPYVCPIPEGVEPPLHMSADVG